MKGVISTPVQFGVGDGSTVQFKLKPNPGELIAQVVLASIYRTDWQGTQLLYATPRTNGLKYSQAFDNAVWVNTGTIVTPDAITAPDGTLTAEHIADASAASAPKNIEQSGLSTILATEQCTWSVFAQAAEYDFLLLRCIATGTGGADYMYSVFNLATGSVGIYGNVGSGTGATPQIEPLPNGWYRCFVTGVPSTNAAATNVQCLVAGQPSNSNGNVRTGTVGSGIYVWGGDLKEGGASSYIPTTTAPITVTDYVLDSTGDVTLTVPPAAATPTTPAATLDWTGTYIYTPTDLPSNFPLNTVISQFANSPTLVQIIKNMDTYIDPSADIDAFYEMVWDLDSAVGVGLDIWGKIVGLPNGRILKIPSAEINLGFREAGNASATPFGSGVFYDGAAITQNYSLSDPAFKTLILVKAMANISDGSIPSYNQLLQNLFAGRGRCYVNDLGNMQMRYTFEFYLEPYEVAILTQSGALPRPTGVLASIIQVQLPDIFGFAEAGTVSAAPFGQGTLFNSGIVYAS